MSEPTEVDHGFKVLNYGLSRIPDKKGSLHHAIVLHLEDAEKPFGYVFPEQDMVALAKEILRTLDPLTSQDALRSLARIAEHFERQ